MSTHALEVAWNRHSIIIYDSDVECRSTLEHLLQYLGHRAEVVDTQTTWCPDVLRNTVEALDGPPPRPSSDHMEGAALLSMVEHLKTIKKPGA